MLTHLELASPRRHHTKCTGDKENRENRDGRGGRDNTLFQHTAPSVTVFVSGLYGSTSYQIKCFNFEKWGHYENQCPKPMQYRTPNNSGQNLAKIGRCIAQCSIGGAVSDNWLLLDKCSNISCAKNKSIISNVTVRPS